MKKSSKVKNGITAIYVRRSVSDKDKGNNSLSIATQKEECIKFVGDCEYKIYCDDGKSAKDVQHRPQFMAMMQDARDGLISRYEMLNDIEAYDGVHGVFKNRTALFMSKLAITMDLCLLWLCDVL